MVMACDCEGDSWACPGCEGYDPQACPSCGCVPGAGPTAGCLDGAGCGWSWDTLLELAGAFERRRLGMEV